ncbi:MAG: hypothetical protein K9L66_08585 [Spirochaetaceae bacterium]|nr:hypothetical protein [Spirochaetaceae bacterium]MCF7949094.1 hypothetical protein [Spirochaetia bacterium]MCF7951549.1 hypothetical protein [Spirochaetaceae bacterium]
MVIPKPHVRGGLAIRTAAYITAVRGRAALAAVVLLLLLSSTASAESITTVKLELFDSVQRSAAGSWLHSGAGSASIKIDQTGNRNVRSQFELSAAILPNNTGVDSLQTISRAYGKFRFESFRGVIGKAPFSWGEGLIFNAADEIFGRGTGANLMQQEFTDPSAWITSLSRYFGPFSFVEVLVNPGLLEIDPDGESESSLLAAVGSAQPAGLEETRAGVRLVTKPGGIKLEGGYLFDGRDGITESPAPTALQSADFYHRLYLSLQGNLWLDWHVSGSLELPDPEHIADSVPSTLWRGQLYTAGVYSMLPVGYDDTLSFRVEARVYPAGSWSQDHSAGYPDYGIFNYGEVNYDFGGGFSILGRTLVNPIDLSARFTPGFSWNLFQGFTLLGFATVQTGEPRDTYAWEAADTQENPAAATPGLAMQLGCSIIY